MERGEMSEGFGVRKVRSGPLLSYPNKGLVNRSLKSTSENPNFPANLSPGDRLGSALVVNGINAEGRMLDVNGLRCLTSW